MREVRCDATVRKRGGPAAEAGGRTDGRGTVVFSEREEGGGRERERGLRAGLAETGLAFVTISRRFGFLWGGEGGYVWGALLSLEGSGRDGMGSGGYF